MSALEPALARLRTDLDDAPAPGDQDDPQAAAPVLDESWQRVDLGPALRGEIVRATPTVLRRDDGAGLFTAGRVNGFHGDSGDGKSMTAGIAAGQELDAGRHVIWIDFEDPDPSTLVERLRDLGVDAETIAAQLHYYGPLEPFDDLAVAEIIRDATEHHATLIVIDSLGEAFGLEGLDENKDVDVAPWMRRVPRRLADAGPAVVTLDHSTKANDNPLHPSGSKRKRAAITGQSYLLEAPIPLTREKGGRLTLKCAKDRHGHYRRGSIVASIDFTVYPDDGMTVHVRAPEARDQAAGPDARLERLARAAVDAAREAEGPVSRKVLEELMDVRASHNAKRAGIEVAVSRGAIRVGDGPRRSLLHEYVRGLGDDLPRAGI